jgi:hypothetical protein
MMQKMADQMSEGHIFRADEQVIKQMDTYPSGIGNCPICRGGWTQETVESADIVVNASPIVIKNKHISAMYQNPLSGIDNTIDESTIQAHECAIQSLLDFRFSDLDHDHTLGQILPFFWTA